MRHGYQPSLFCCSLGHVAFALARKRRYLHDSDWSGTLFRSGGLKKDAEGTVRAVAQLGYQCVEFYAPYFEWTEAQAKSMRKLMDDLGFEMLFDAQRVKKQFQRRRTSAGTRSQSDLGHEVHG